MNDSDMLRTSVISEVALALICSLGDEVSVSEQVTENI